MKIHLTRDSIAMGDDVDASHFHTIELPENVTIIEIVGAIINSNYLASIAGGKASWSLVSNNPIAIIAQQWSQAKILPQFNHSLGSLLKDAGGYKCHINYHAQLDPDIVCSVMSSN
ncbi:MAG: hypothetical protein COA63_002720 [Methylophaga sp.]|nr:hypothetical protein [Methylophaga sp.]